MYSREEILAMPAGRELDALVAEQVMELARYEGNWEEVSGKFAYSVHEFCPSTSIESAWEVVEKMRLESWGVTITSWGHDETMGEDPWLVTFGFQGGPCNFMSLSFPEAACKAALLSLLKED